MILVLVFRTRYDGKGYYIAIYFITTSISTNPVELRRN